MPRPLLRLAAPVALALLAACTTPPSNPAYGTPRPGWLTGSARYLNRMALTPQAMLSVQIVDVTEAKAPKTLVERRFEQIGQVPVRFELQYDPPGTDPRHRYQVQARIDDGPRRYANRLVYPVLTQGAPEYVDLVLDSAR